MSQKTTISVGTLTLMTVAAVISLRGLPMMAKEGLSMVFYILFATILFLIPAALVSAELGSMYSDKGGGVYTWVKEALGAKWGITAIWLQWIQNVIWYPTVLGFAAGSLAYLFMKPELANNGYYSGIIIVILYWLATYFTLKGTTTLAKITKYGVMIGTIIPGVIIIILGFIWLLRGFPLEFLQTALVDGEHVHPSFFPHISGLSSIAFLAGIILLFAGIEVQGVRVNEMKNPAKEFPQAMLYASVVIFILFLLGSLSVAAVVPMKDISLTSGLMEAFQAMFARFNLGYLVPILGFMTAFGAIGGVMSWISGPSKGLLQTAQEGELPPFFAKVNKQGVQVNILLIQGIIVTILASLYFIMANVSVAFFVLSAMTVTLYLVMYILMYISALVLRYKHPEVKRVYEVPGGKTGMWITAIIGLLGVTFALIVGFFPPSILPVGNPTLYVMLVTFGLIIFVSIPLLMHKMKKSSWLATTQANAKANESKSNQ